MSGKWLYRMFGEEFGPVSREQILELIEDGTLASDDQVRSEEAETWFPVSEFTEKSESTAAAGDEMKEFEDLSELNLWSEGDDKESSASSATPSGEVEDDESEVRCYCESMGEVLGPLSLFDLVGLADSGTLGESDRVRFGEDGDWILPMDIPELAAAIFSTDFGDDEDSEAGTTDESTDTSATSEPAAEAGSDAPDTETDRQPAKGTGSAKKKGRDSRKPILESSLRKTGRKRRKKKKRDALLEEIFSEVFTKDGKLKPESQHPTAQSADQQSPRQGQTAGLGVSESPTSGQAAAAPSSVPAAATPPAGSVPSAAMSKPAGPPAVPKPQQKRRNSGGSSFSMPEPKTLGIAGGVLVAVLLVTGIVTGMIPMPGFGPDPKSTLTDLSAEYKMMAGSVDEAEWSAFTKKAVPDLRAIIAALSKQEGLSEQEKIYQAAAVEFYQLVKCDADDIDKRHEKFASFQEAFSGD